MCTCAWAQVSFRNTLEEGLLVPSHERLWIFSSSHVLDLMLPLTIPSYWHLAALELK